MEFQAELRVYEPLSRFDDRLATHIARATPRDRDAVEAASAQRAEARNYARELNPFPRPDLPELVRVLRFKVPAEDRPDTGPTQVGGPHDGAVAGHSEFFCPEELALRSEMAATKLERDLMDDHLYWMMVPERTREKNVARLLTGDSPVRLPKDHNRRPVHTRAAVWGIPLAWFVLFGDDARARTEAQLTTELSDQVVTGTHPHTGSFIARRITRLTLAQERARRAAATVSLHAPDWEVLEDLTGLVTWLESFHPDAYLELDYGGLARFVWPDDSVFDVATALEALEQGDAPTAMIANQRLVRRWMSVRQRGRAS
ncbi:MAG: hypothetical protein ACTHZ5_03800 [Micrococcaceae bacterium]